MKKNGAKKKTALSFYDSDDKLNQYYIDKANYRQLLISYSLGEVTAYSYEDVLLKLATDGMFLKEIDDTRINKKMCEIALYQNMNSIKFIPIDLLCELFIKLSIKYNKNRDERDIFLILDTILGEIESKGLSLHKITDEKADSEVRRCRSNKVIAEVYYGKMLSAYKADESNFKIIREKLFPSYLDGLYYSEVLISLSNDGMLLEYIHPKNINLKMCEVAIYQNKNALQFVPTRYLKAIKDYFNLSQEDVIVYRLERLFNALPYSIFVLFLFTSAYRLVLFYLDN